MPGIRHQEFRPYLVELVNSDLSYYRLSWYITFVPVVERVDLVLLVIKGDIFSPASLAMRDEEFHAFPADIIGKLESVMEYLYQLRISGAFKIKRTF